MSPPTPDDIAATIAALPAEMQPETPILTRDEARTAAWKHAASHLDDVHAAWRHAHNYCEALTHEYLKLARYIVAAHATPAPVPARYGTCAVCDALLLTEAEADLGRCPWCETKTPAAPKTCREWLLGLLATGPKTVGQIIDAQRWPHEFKDKSVTMWQLEKDGIAEIVDGRYRLVSPDPADADLRLASDSFRLAGSPFAVRDSLPAIHRPDMATGTLPGESAAAAMDVFEPTADQIRSALADRWDADDDDPTPAEAIILDLAAMKDRMHAAHRSDCNAIG